MDYSLKVKSSNLHYFALPIVTAPGQISRGRTNPQIQESRLRIAALGGRDPYMY